MMKKKTTSAWDAAERVKFEWVRRIEGTNPLTGDQFTILQYVICDAIRRDRERQRRK